MDTAARRDAFLVVRVWAQDDVVRGRLLTPPDDGTGAHQLVTVTTCAGIVALAAAVEVWLREFHASAAVDRAGPSRPTDG